MAGILDSIRQGIVDATPLLGGVNKAIAQAGSSPPSDQNNAELQSYKDKYGPNVGARIYQQDQAAKATPAGQGHMGSWADKEHPVGR